MKFKRLLVKLAIFTRCRYQCTHGAYLFSCLSMHWIFQFTAHVLCALFCRVTKAPKAAHLLIGITKAVNQHQLLLLVKCAAINQMKR